MSFPFLGNKVLGSAFCFFVYEEIYFSYATVERTEQRRKGFLVGNPFKGKFFIAYFHSTGNLSGSFTFSTFWGEVSCGRCLFARSFDNFPVKGLRMLEYPIIPSIFTNNCILG